MPKPRASNTPIEGKVVKKVAKKPSPIKHVYHTCFTVHGPVTVMSTYGTYTIGDGDQATFRTNKGKTITTTRVGDVITVVAPSTMKRSFVVDTLGPKSSAVMDFGGFTSVMSGRSASVHF